MNANASNRHPPDLIKRDFIACAIIELGGSQAFMRTGGGAPRHDVVAVVARASASAMAMP